jgi:F-type H+-transporting ATPase subunit epsilon
MKLKILLPAEILLEEEVVKVSAEGENGAFTLLPRHIDFVSALVPGLLSFEREDGSEQFAAVDEGILVKCGFDVSVSTRNAALSDNLEELDEMIQRQFSQWDEEQQAARSAFARLEADLVRRFLELETPGHVR